LLLGTSRHFAAAQLIGRFRRERSGHRAELRSTGPKSTITTGSSWMDLSNHALVAPSRDVDRVSARSWHRHSGLNEARRKGHIFLDIRLFLRYRQASESNLAYVKDASRVTTAGGASAVPAGKGSSPSGNAPSSRPRIKSGAGSSPRTRGEGAASAAGMGSFALSCRRR